MQEQDLEQLKYPISEFIKPESLSREETDQHINVIEQLPDKLIHAVYGLMDEQLDTPYRPGGWTIRQVVHHLVDSHINSYIRFKWTLTEDNPTIKAYQEKDWAELPEAKDGPIEVSLKLLEALHVRWCMMLKNLTAEEMAKTFIHPETGQQVRLDTNIANYAWHCELHYAHIINLKRRKGW